MIPPPDSPEAPKYWMQETSGVLRPVMEKLLTTDTLSLREIAIVRSYFKQWINSPAWDMNPHQSKAAAARLTALRRTAEEIQTIEDISKWIAAAVAEGIDPL